MISNAHDLRFCYDGHFILFNLTTTKRLGMLIANADETSKCSCETPMKTVITYGTFDLFHIGHVRILKRLSDLGDRLIVGVSTDAFNELKGKKSVVSFEHRVEILMACRYVDDVFAEENWDQKPADIKRFNADIFAMGSDWVNKFDDLKIHCQVLYLPRTEGVSTTDLRVGIADGSKG